MLASAPGRIFIPGGGLICKDSCAPTSRTVLRAQAAADYYHNNPGIFDDPRAFIAASGGHNHDSTEGISEVRHIHLVLEQDGVPQELFINHAEYLAGDSAQNLLFAVRAGIILPEQYSKKEPLRIATNDNHRERLSVLGHHLGFPIESFVTLESGEIVDPAEPILLEQTKRMFAGVEIGNLGQFEARRMALVKHLNSPPMLEGLASARAEAGYLLN